MRYTIRYNFLWIPRRVIRLMAKVVSAVPGTTFGEVAEMHSGPCSRCVGYAIRGPLETYLPPSQVGGSPVQTAKVFFT